MRKLVVDTDIGSDVDDAFAVLLVLASPEVDLAAITLVHANLDVRARIAAKLLALAGRMEVPIYKGMSETLSRKRRLYWAGNEGAGLDLDGTEAVRVETGGVEKIVELAGKHGPDLALAPIGPMTNIAAAIQAAPDVMRGIGRLYVMASVLQGVGEAAAGREHNVNCDPEAAQVVFSSGIPITLVGLNVTMKVWLTGRFVDSMKGRTLLGDYMALMAEKFFEAIGRRMTYMHDPLAVASILEPSLLKTERYRAEVLTEGEDSGKTVFWGDGEPKLDVAVDVDVEAFDKLFQPRVMSLI